MFRGALVLLKYCQKTQILRNRLGGGGYLVIEIWDRFRLLSDSARGVLLNPQIVVKILVDDVKVKSAP